MDKLAEIKAIVCVVEMRLCQDPSTREEWRTIVSQLGEAYDKAKGVLHTADHGIKDHPIKD